MFSYDNLRMVRVFLWGAFVLSLPLAVNFASDPGVANIVRWAPPILLVFALLAGLAERIVRKREGLPARRFGAGSR